jgi:hypothetical protein
MEPAIYGDKFGPMPLQPPTSRMRVSSTCTIWESATSFRIRTRYVPLWMTLPFLAFTGSMAGIFSKEPKSGPAVLMDLLILIDIYAMFFGFNFAASPGSYRTWYSCAWFRFHVCEIPPGNVVEIAASSVWVMSNMMYNIQFRRSGERLENVIPFWNEGDLKAAGQALSVWLNERRAPNTEPIVFTQTVRGPGESRRAR